VSYRASVVKIGNTASSRARFEKKNAFFYFVKRSSLCITALAL
jgi:hypothetical protein